MHVVIVSDFAEVNGGAAQVAITSARGLADAGISVIFVCAMEPISEQLRHPKIDVRCLGFDSVWAQRNLISAARQGIWNNEAQAAFRRVLSSLPAAGTVVHFHQWTKAFSPSVLSVPSEFAIASVISLHDYFFSCPNGTYYHYGRGAACNLKPMSTACLLSACDKHGNLHKAVRMVRQRAIGSAAHKAGASLSVLSVSSFAERVVAPFLSPEHNRFVVRSPISVTRQTPAPVAENREFIFVGRLTEEKGVRLLAQVARDTALPLTIVGDGPLAEMLRGLGDPVHLAGWMAAPALLEILRRARALVFPSTWYETGGLVVLEALAQGVPVIVSRTTAAADFVVDNENGFLFTPGDQASLRAAMTRLVDDDTARRLGSEAYRRYWAAPNTVEAHTDELLHVYRQMLVRQRNRSAAPAAA